MIEMTVIMWVQALIVKEIKDVFKDGLMEYLSDMWNLADLMRQAADHLTQEPASFIFLVQLRRLP